MTYILSGGDLDGDQYFVSWNQMFNGIDNAPLKFNYPKENIENRQEQREFTRDDLIEDFSKCIQPDSIGLLHYNLTCLYDKDKCNMLNSNYTNYIIEINKAIDGLQLNSRQFFEKKPKWY